MYRPKLRHLLLAALLLPVLHACEIPFSLENTARPKIYVQCLPADGQTMLQVLYAAPAYGNASTIFDFHPSEIRLSVNGSDVPVVPYEDAEGLVDGRFVSSAPMREGDAVSLSVSGDEVRTVSGSTRIPPRPLITRVEHEKVRIDTVSGTRVTLTLDRAPGPDEYYGIQILQRTLLIYIKDDLMGQDTLETYVTPGQVLTMAEAGAADMDGYVTVNYADGLLGRGVDAPMTLLGRRQFDGARYSFYLNSFDAGLIAYWLNPGRIPGMVNPGNWQQPGEEDLPEDEQDGEDDTIWDPDKLYLGSSIEYNFMIYRLTPELYHYGKALYQSNFDFLSNMGLTPANFTYTNISDGLGVVGAFARSETGFHRLD